MDHVNNLVKSILTLSNSEDGISPEEVQNQFEMAIADKVSNALDYAKVEIADSLYKEEVEQIDEASNWKVEPNTRKDSVFSGEKDLHSVKHKGKTVGYVFRNEKNNKWTSHHSRKDFGAEGHENKNQAVTYVKQIHTEEFEQIDEKAPPGAKYERMVKHIKAKYAKDGLTNKEKAIAYATAWKAKKANEEVEQVDEKYMGFNKLKAAIARKGGVRDPGAVAAAIGRKKYGKKKFQAMAAAGKRMKEEVEQVDEAPISLRGLTPAQIAAKKKAASKFRDEKFRKIKELSRKTDPNSK